MPEVAELRTKPEERFEKIDSWLVIEKLQAEKKNDEIVSPVVKKIIRHPDLPAKLTELLNDGIINAKYSHAECGNEG